MKVSVKWNLRVKLGYNLPWVQNFCMCDYVVITWKKMNILHMILFCMLWCFLPIVCIQLVHAGKHSVPDHSASTVDHHWQNWFPYVVFILWIVLHSSLTVVWILQYCDWSLLLYAPELFVRMWLIYFLNVGFGHLVTGSKYVYEGFHVMLKLMFTVWIET